MRGQAGRSGLSLRWSRLIGVEVDVFVCERRGSGSGAMVCDRLTISHFEHGVARILTRDGERELREGMTVVTPARDVAMLGTVSAQARYTSAIVPPALPLEISDSVLGRSVTDEIPPVLESAGLSRAMLALKHVAIECPEDELACEEVWTDVVHEICLATNDTGHADERPSGRRRSEHVAVRAVREYLHDDAYEQVRLDDLARLTGFTRPYLIKTFREATGLPPHQYRIRVRLWRAFQMIMNGVPAVRAALACGFADQSHFSRSFHRVYGVTPTEAFAGHRASKNENRIPLSLRMAQESSLR